MRTFHDSQEENPAMFVYVCIYLRHVCMYVFMWQISFGLCLERRFNSISFKHDRIIDTMENCIDFRSNRSKEGELGAEFW